MGVCDREADLYDLFVEQRAKGVEWLVRAAWNRRVSHPESYLWQAMQAVAPPGHNVVTSTRPRSGSRTYGADGDPLRPNSHPQTEPFQDRGLCRGSGVRSLAIEKEPPPGHDPVEWMLLTSVETNTMEEALERLSWYARRWTIETWHRMLKSGCQIEARQFGDVERFRRATALFAVIAWRILYATLLGRLDADVSCEVLLQRFEWQALYCRTHGVSSVPPIHPS